MNKTFAVLSPRRNHDCDGDRKLSTFVAILDRTVKDNVFRSAESRTMSAHLLVGRLVYLAFVDDQHSFIFIYIQ